MGKQVISRDKQPLTEKEIENLRKIVFADNRIRLPKPSLEYNISNVPGMSSEGTESSTRTKKSYQTSSNLVEKQKAKKEKERIEKENIIPSTNNNTTIQSAEYVNPQLQQRWNELNEASEQRRKENEQALRGLSLFLEHDPINLGYQAVKDISENISDQELSGKDEFIADIVGPTAASILLAGPWGGIKEGSRQLLKQGAKEALKEATKAGMKKGAQKAVKKDIAQAYKTLTSKTVSIEEKRAAQQKLIDITENLNNTTAKKTTENVEQSIYGLSARNSGLNNLKNAVGDNYYAIINKADSPKLYSDFFTPSTVEGQGAKRIEYTFNNNVARTADRPGSIIIGPKPIENVNITGDNVRIAREPSGFNFGYMDRSGNWQPISYDELIDMASNGTRSERMLFNPERNILTRSEKIKQWLDLPNSPFTTRRKAIGKSNKPWRYKADNIVKGLETAYDVSNALGDVSQGIENYRNGEDEAATYNFINAGRNLTLPGLRFLGRNKRLNVSKLLPLRYLSTLNTGYNIGNQLFNIDEKSGIKPQTQAEILKSLGFDDAAVNKILNEDSDGDSQNIENTNDYSTTFEDRINYWSTPQ